jgi:hypothetical protein
MNWTYADGSKDTGVSEYLFSFGDIDPSKITIGGDDNSSAFEVDVRTLDSANAITELDPRDRSTESKTSLMGIAYFVTRQDAEEAAGLFRHAAELCVQERPSPEAIAEQQRQQVLADAEQQRQKAIRDANELAALRGRIDQDMQKLAQLMENDFKTEFTITDTKGEFQDNSSHEHIIMHVTTVDHCSLSFVVGSKGKQQSYTLDLAGKSAQDFEYNDRFQRTYVGGVEEVLINGFYFRPTLPASKWPDVIRLINELGRACSP